MNLSKVKEIWKPEQGSDLGLLPCPFCGGTEVAYFRYKHIAGDRYGVLCCDCMANIDPGWAQQRSVVQARWNRRTSCTAHGKWVHTEGNLYYCSVCSGYPSYIPTQCRMSKFCPNCGAKMDMK